jgi:hypothetical protein
MSKFQGAVREPPLPGARAIPIPKRHAIALVGLWPIFGFLRRQRTCRASAARHPLEQASDIDSELFIARNSLF